MFLGGLLSVRSLTTRGGRGDLFFESERVLARGEEVRGVGSVVFGRGGMLGEFPALLECLMLGVEVFRGRGEHGGAAGRAGFLLRGRGTGRVGGVREESSVGRIWSDLERDREELARGAGDGSGSTCTAVVVTDLVIASAV